MSSSDRAGTFPSHRPAPRPIARRYDAWRNEVHHALGRDCAFSLCGRIGDRAVAFRGAGGGEDPRRANLSRHQLRDGVQLAGRVLPATCLIPGTTPIGAATTGGNANQSTACQLNCTTIQINCQALCARTSPSP